MIGHLTDLKYIKYLEGRIRLLGLESYVSLLDFKTDIKEYIESIDIVVHCAINEPFGRVLIDSMAWGYFIVYESEAASEIISHNLNGILVKKRMLTTYIPGSATLY